MEGLHAEEVEGETMTNVTKMTEIKRLKKAFGEGGFLTRDEMKLLMEYYLNVGNTVDASDLARAFDGNFNSEKEGSSKFAMTNQCTCLETLVLDDDEPLSLVERASLLLILELPLECRETLEGIHDCLHPSHRGKLCPYIKQLFFDQPWAHPHDRMVVADADAVATDNEKGHRLADLWSRLIHLYNRVWWGENWRQGHA